MVRYFNRLVNFFIPSRLKANPENFRKSRGIIITSLLTAPWGLLFAQNYHSLGVAPPLVAANIAFTLSLVSIPVLLRITGSPFFAANQWGISAFSLLSFCCFYSGGLYNQSILSLPCVPLAVICFGHSYSGIFWTLATIGDAAVMNYMEKHGHHFEQLPVSPIVFNQLWLSSFIAMTTTISFVLVYYEKIRGELYRAIQKRAEELEEKNRVILQQQNQLVTSSKMAALGEMAGGVAHEINSPLAAIKNLAGQLQDVLSDEQLDKASLKEMANDMESTTDRIAKIIQGLRSFSRDGSKDPYQIVNVQKLIEDTLNLCRERFKNAGIDLKIEPFRKDMTFEGRSIQISQVILNLLNNAYDALEQMKEKWIKISVHEDSSCVEVRVTDGGKGIPEQVRDKIFQPFFTTKDINKGTGMGLSVSMGIIQGHQGALKLDPSSPHTSFIVRIPKEQKSEVEKSRAA